MIGCLFVFLVLFGHRTAPRRAVAQPLGSVVSLVGEAEVRPEGGMDFSTLAANAAVSSGELIVVHEASQVVLKFDGGASVRLQPGARFVAERDLARGAGVLATLISGDADVLSAGSGFHLMKEGRDITAAGSSASGAPDVIVAGGGARTFMPSAAASAAVVTATTPVDTPIAQTQPQAPGPGPVGTTDATGEKVSADSLSNEEIRRALRNEGGFYQRCYLTYLNRTKAPAQPMTITVGFVIANSGKVRDAKIVRSDFNDATLNKCILETIERTPFRAFKAADIPVLEFPIELH